MRPFLAAALLSACASGPRLDERPWTLVGFLPGPGAAIQGTCDLEFEAIVGRGLVWTHDCGRNDLPTGADEVAHITEAGWVYDVSGGSEGTKATWVTRDGDHPGLFELWVYPAGTEILTGRAYDASSVLLMF